MKIDARFADASEEFRFADRSPSHDAKLLAACERFEELWLKWGASIAEGDEERLEANREIKEIIALADAISQLEPVSPAGRRAVGCIALMTLEVQGDAQNRLAYEAIRSYVTNDLIAPARVSLPTAAPASRGKLPTRQKSAMSEPLLLTVARAAEQLAVNPETIRRAIRNGRLVPHKFGGCIRISWEQLQAFLDEGKCSTVVKESSIPADADAPGQSNNGTAAAVAALRRERQFRKLARK
jgi:excisionase family DNA binding protein